MSQRTQTARQPLLEDTTSYYEDGLSDGMVPPDPFAGLHQHHEPAIVVENQQVELQDNEFDNAAPPTECIEKLGLFLGIIIGVTVQLSALAGNYVNVTVWGTEDGPYATTTFVVWCCFMSSMFFFAFALLRCLVQMSLHMAQNMQQQEKDVSTTNTTIVAEIPSDNPLPNPSGFPNLVRRDSISSAASTTTPKDHDEVLEDVMWHMKLHYVLGINVGISFSWIATNVALGNERVSLIFALTPPLLGWIWFSWMKQQDLTNHHKDLLANSSRQDTLPTISEELDVL